MAAVLTARNRPDTRIERESGFARFPVPDLPAVDLDHRDDHRGSSAKQDLVAAVELGSMYTTLDHG
jgi:hypothetical protein